MRSGTAALGARADDRSSCSSRGHLISIL
jgi:hypothetical protein